MAFTSEVDLAIVDEQYNVFPDCLVTVCCLTLDNGFTVVGSDAGIPKENVFRQCTGEQIAKNIAKQKVGEYLRFMKQQKKHEGK